MTTTTRICLGMLTSARARREEYAVNDAFLAATAAEARCRLVTRDSGFSRFPGLD